MKRKVVSIKLFVVLAAVGAIAGKVGAVVQHPGPKGSKQVMVLQGYSASVAGERMSYHSPLPGNRVALITRAAEEWDPISWRTEAVSLPRDAGPVRFAWLAGLGCNLGNRLFTLRVAGIDTIDFHTIDQEEWAAAGSEGAILKFRSLYFDHHGDRFGLMTLEVPGATLRPGEPLELSIAGEKAGSQAWVMTFEEPLTEGIALTPQPVLLRREGGSRQPIDLTVLRLGDLTELTVRAKGIDPLTRTVPFGFTTVRLEFPPAVDPTPITLEIGFAGVETRREIRLDPVRRWTVELIQHTHTDIGYTRPQTEILAEHLRYIDSALDYCDATDSLPEEARFRWTCEVSWPVREYLRVRPRAQIDRLIRRVRQGRIELTAMPLNMGEVADERLLASSLRWIEPVLDAGLSLETAMQNDVNGFAWSLLDPLAGLGVRYLSMGENTHRALKPFDIPTVFWWESPSGRRLLAYRSDHYMTANFWGILGSDMDRFAAQLLDYLRGLDDAGYPHAKIGVQYVGYFTDNAPPSTFANAMIRRWNDEYEWPRLRTSTMAGFLSGVEEKHAASLPVIRAAWPDWWTDGFGSAMRETAAARQTQSEQTAILGLLAIARLLGAEVPSALLEAAATVDDLLLFYNEHTFGAAESISDPLSVNSQVQWLEKASYAWQAVMQARLLREGAFGVLDPYIGADSCATITVFNTLNWPRSGAVRLFADHQILPREGGWRIVGDDGRAIPVQLESSRAEGSYWTLWVDAVPPLGFRTYTIDMSAPARIEPDPGSSADEWILETSWYRIVVDPARSGIVSIFDKEIGHELLEADAEHALGEAVYERLAGRSSMEKLTLGDHTRTSWRDLVLEALEEGPVYRSLRLSGRIDGFEGLRCEIRLFETEKRIEILYEGRKLPVTDPEGLYVAFPFDLPDGRLFFEAQGAEISPGLDQIPGTASDWNTVQSYAAVRSPAAQIVLVSEEAPLMQFGGINTGRYQRNARPEANRIYSWVLNNYWVTNFRASQEGEIRWSYAITSSARSEGSQAARFGWGTRIPMPARVKLPSAPTATGRKSPLPDLDRDDILLVAAAPHGETGEVLFFLREIGAPQARTTAGGSRPLSFPGLIPADPLGVPLRTPPTPTHGALSSGWFLFSPGRSR